MPEYDNEFIKRCLRESWKYWKTNIYNQKSKKYDFKKWLYETYNITYMPVDSKNSENIVFTGSPEDVMMFVMKWG